MRRHLLIGLLAIAACSSSDDTAAPSSIPAVSDVAGLRIELSPTVATDAEGQPVLTVVLHNVGEIAVEADGLWELQQLGDDGVTWSAVGYLPFVGSMVSALCIDREECESAPAIVTVDPGDELSRTVLLDELPTGTYRVVYPQVSESQQTATTIEL
ncbi:MAG: hypothetical protein ABMA25_11650 [Ilumatobacteraceae bacterium]